MRRQVAMVATATMVSSRGEAGGDGVRPSAREGCQKAALFGIASSSGLAVLPQGGHLGAKG